MTRFALLLLFALSGLSIQAQNGSLQLLLHDPTLDQTQAAIVRFSDHASTSIDPNLDILSHQNTPLSIFTRSEEGSALQVNALPSLKHDQRIPLEVEVQKRGKYVFNYDFLEPLPFYARIYLMDLQTQKSYPIVYTFPLTLELDPSDKDRFSLVFSLPVKAETVLAPCGSSKDGTVVVSDIGNTNWNYLLADASGNILQVCQEVNEVDTLRNLAAGDYTLYAGNDYGAIEPVTFTVSPKPLDLMASLSTPIAADSSDGSIQLEVANGLAPYTYAWSSGEATAQVKDLKAGAYQVTVTDSRQCKSQMALQLSVEETPEKSGVAQFAGQSLGSFHTNEANNYILPDGITFQLRFHNDKVFLVHDLPEKQKVELVVKDHLDQEVAIQAFTCKPGKTIKLKLENSMIWEECHYEVYVGNNRYPVSNPSQLLGVLTY